MRVRPASSPAERGRRVRRSLGKAGWGARTVALSLLVSLLSGGGATLLPGSGVAWAEADKERSARQHFRQGEARYAAGKYGEALADYQAGYDVQPLPGFLVNIAQCQRRMGDLQRARASYGKFVLVAPDSPLAPEVRRLIAELDRLIAETAAASSPASAAGGTPAAAGRSTFEIDSMKNDVLPLDLAEPSVPLHVAPGANLTTPTAPIIYGTPTVSSTPADEVTAAAPARRWWLWGTVGAVVVGAAAVTLAVVLAAPDANIVHDGTLGSLRR